MTTTSKGAAFALRPLLSNAAVYGTADLVSKGGAYALVPILTRGLDRSSFGSYVLVTSVIQLLSLALSLGLGSAVTRFWFDLSPERRRRFQMSSWLFLQSSVFVVALILTVLARPLFGALFPGVPSGLFVFGIWAAFFLTSATVPLAVLRAEERPKLFVVLASAQFLFPATGVIIALGTGGGVHGVLWGHLAGCAAVFVLAIAMLRPLVAFPADWSMLGPALAFGIPLVPHLISHWALNVLDRVAIQHVLGAASIAVYTVGYQIGQTVSLAATAFQNSFIPSFFRAAGAGHKEVLGRFWTPYLLGMGSISMGLALWAPEAVRVLAPPKYAASAGLVPWIALGYWFLAAYYLPVTALFQAKKVRALPLLTAGCALLNLGLNFAMLPHFGLAAAAYNTVIAYFALLAGVLWLAQRSAPLPYRYTHAVALLVLGVGIYMASLALPDGAAGTVLKGPVFLAFIGGGWLIVRREFAAVRELGRLALHSPATPDAPAQSRALLVAATTTQARTMAATAAALAAHGLEPVCVCLDNLYGNNARLGFEEAGREAIDCGPPPRRPGKRRNAAMVLQGPALADRLLVENGATAVVIGNDFTPFERLLIQAAEHHHVVSVLLQDGAIALEGDAPGAGARSGSSVTGRIKRILGAIGLPFAPSAYGTAGCDVVAVLGPSTARALERRGVEAERIEITGQPRYDALHRRARNKRDILLVTTQPFAKYGLATAADEARVFGEMIEAAAGAAAGREIVVKFHPEQDAAGRSALASRFPSVHVEHTAPIEGFLSRAAALVTLSSTTALEAMILGVPVVVVDAPGFPSTLPFVSSGAAAGASGREQIAAALRGVLSGDDRRSEARERFLSEHCAPLDGRASARFAARVAAEVAGRAALVAAAAGAEQPDHH